MITCKDANRERDNNPVISFKTDKIVWETVEYYKTPYEGYYISRSGVMISLWTNKATIRYDKKPKKLKYNLNGSGYYQVVIKIDGIKRQVMIHKIVALTFLGPRPNGYVIDHINCIKTDNRIENLRYVTYSYNNKRRFVEKNAQAHNAVKVAVFLNDKIIHYDSLRKMKNDLNLSKAFVERMMKECQPWHQDCRSPYILKRFKKIQETIEIVLVNNKFYKARE